MKSFYIYEKEAGWKILTAKNRSLYTSDELVKVCGMISMLMNDSNELLVSREAIH